MQDPAQNPYVASSQTPGGGSPGSQMHTTIATAARIGTVISLALVMGVTTITGILVYLIVSDLPPDQSLFRWDGDALPFLVVGYAVFIGATVAALVIPRVMVRQAQVQFQASDVNLPQPLRGDSPLPSSAQSFLGTLSTCTLIGQALMEGPAIVNAVLMFVENNFAHAIPIGLGIIGILLQLPSQSKLINKLEDAKRGRSM